MSLPIASFKSHNFHLIHVILFNKILTMIANSRYILAFGFFNSTYYWQPINPMIFLRLASFLTLSTGHALFPMCPLPGQIGDEQDLVFFLKKLTNW